MVPFFKDHLKQQIESAGGVVYNNFEDVPKKKYRTCCLLAPFPCITAKYVQCLAANITVSINYINSSNVIEYNSLFFFCTKLVPIKS